MRRRAFLQLFVSGAIAAGGARSGHTAVPVPALSAWSEGDGETRRYFAGRIAGDAHALALSARAHALTAHPQRARDVYVCARRPGAYLIRFDPLTGVTTAETEAGESYRFEGHAVVDAQRHRVLATESDLEQGQGRVGLYDADTLARLGEWPSHGIGPHELLWFGRDVLAVANGGILTLPETGRIKRNLDTMEPSLALLDARDGRAFVTFTLPDRKLSIRHLAQADDGVLGAALQYEGHGAAPLLALLREGQFRVAETAPSIGRRLGGYAAGIAACGDRFAVTATRGDCIAIWDTRGRYCGAVAMRKPAGIVTIAGRWWVSNELGEIWEIDAADARVINRRHTPNRRWDNHLAVA